MKHVDSGDAGRDNLQATLLPMVYDPESGRLFWLGADRRMVSCPVDGNGHTCLAAAVAAPVPGIDKRLEVVGTLLRDIAAYTCRPLHLPTSQTDPDDHAEYAVIWVSNSHCTATPRQAAEQAWRMIRRFGSQACVFQVVDRRTGRRTEIDLLVDSDGVGVDDASKAVDQD